MISYDELDVRLKRLNKEDIEILKAIEQSIPNNYKTSGPCRVCYFRNAHKLEEYIKDNLVGRDIIAGIVLSEIDQKNRLILNDPKNLDVSIDYYDDSHNDFHEGEGTPNPDFMITIDNIGQIGHDVVDDNWNTKTEFEFISPKNYTGEVKIIYKPDKRLESDNLHGAKIIYEYRWNTKILSIYRRGYNNVLYPCGEIPLDNIDLWDPYKFAATW